MIHNFDFELMIIVDDVYLFKNNTLCCIWIWEHVIRTHIPMKLEFATLTSSSRILKPNEIASPRVVSVEIRFKVSIFSVTVHYQSKWVSIRFYPLRSVLSITLESIGMDSVVGVRSWHETISNDISGWQHWMKNNDSICVVWRVPLHFNIWKC